MPFECSFEHSGRTATYFEAPNCQPTYQSDGKNGAVLIRPTAVEARGGYRIWIQFSDGSAGVIDLSHLAGRGVFEVWLERSNFENVRITPNRAVAWEKTLSFVPMHYTCNLRANLYKSTCHR